MLAGCIKARQSLAVQGSRFARSRTLRFLRTFLCNAIFSHPRSGLGNWRESSFFTSGEKTNVKKIIDENLLSEVIEQLADTG